MIDGAHLAATAKHTPELLDPDDVRVAGRPIETFSDLLAGMQSWKRIEKEGDEDQFELTFIVSGWTHGQVSFLAWGDE